MRDSILFWEDEPEPRRPVTMVYPFPLRPDYLAWLKLPDDLTRKDVDRLHTMLETLIVPIAQTPQS